LPVSLGMVSSSSAMGQVNSPSSILGEIDYILFHPKLSIEGCWK
jgi:hypothetical protein